MKNKAYRILLRPARPLENRNPYSGSHSRLFPLPTTCCGLSWGNIYFQAKDATIHSHFKTEQIIDVLHTCQIWRFFVVRGTHAVWRWGEFPPSRLKKIISEESKWYIAGEHGMGAFHRQPAASSKGRYWYCLQRVAMNRVTAAFSLAM